MPSEDDVNNPYTLVRFDRSNIGGAWEFAYFDESNQLSWLKEYSKSGCLTHEQVISALSADNIKNGKKYGYQILLELDQDHFYSNRIEPRQV